ncbi:MAG: ActS/PrrB/RegB family redox-sensitive histidine kinase [Pseudomonadota bacterium]
MGSGITEGRGAGPSSEANPSRRANPARVANPSRVANPARVASVHPGSMRLRTLILLRWLAINGQTAAIVFVHFQMGFDLPLWPCLGVIGASVWLNLILSSRFPQSKRLSETESALYLAFDIVQLSLLLMFTGGLQNPFALLLLAPVTIAASTLHLRTALMLLGLAFACGTGLALWYWPLPWSPGEALILPQLYILGLWAALVLGLSFMMFYAARIANEARRLSEALTQGRLSLAREQKLSALGGLAAAAAHELGTPLASIYLVAREMQKEVPEGDPLREDVDILMGEAKRCREILGRLSRAPDETDGYFAKTRLGDLLEELAAKNRTGEKAVHVHAQAASSAVDTAEPIVDRSPELLQGLGNLLHNAVDFARSRVDVQASWTGDGVSVEISDDGPGFRSDLLDRLGEPYVTSRPRGVDAPREDETGGMGLGFFIAKTMLEHTGAVLSFGNKKGKATGAVVRIVWRRSHMEGGRS